MVHAILVLLVLATGSLHAQSSPAARADAIFKTAGRDTTAWRLAVGRIRPLLEEAPADPTVHAILGALYLRLAEGDSARAVLTEAVRLDSSLAGAHFGLGRVALELDDDPAEAIPHFDAALGIDSTYAEALAQKALALQRVGERRQARRAADSAIGLDPDLAVPYRILAESYVEDGNTKASLVYFKRYLDRNPNDQETAFTFARQLYEAERWDELFEVTSRLSDPRSLPLLAVSLIRRGDHEGALAAFRDYIDNLDEEEAELYDDITYVGRKREIQAYRTVPESAREAFLDRFWMLRDPFKTTGGAMRRAEHYRRVWYARRHFGQKKWPWDRRGEVYIRYGEPYWRSTSKDMNAIVPPAAQQVQDQMAARLYGSTAVDYTFVGPVYPIRNQTDAGLRLSDPLGGEGDLGLQGWKPVTTGSDWSTVPWESWIYPDVGEGIEISFTDEFLSGVYDYAPIPTLSEDDMTRLELADGSPLAFISRMTEFAPSALVSRVSSEQPQRYDLGIFEPLHFYYETLAFRGESGKTDLQINIALPIDNVALPDDPDTTVVVERRVVLLKGAREVERSVENLGVAVGPRHRDQGLLAAERVNIQVEPGEYEMRVQARRHNTNRTQVYGQALDLQDYGRPDLALSDLQIAQHIAEADPERPSRFARGGWDIRPAPARSFRRGEPLFVYYEIYNLTRDEFGQSHYRIAYEVETRTEEGRIKIPFLAKLRRGGNEKIGFGFEQTGSKETETDYFQLDLEDARPGRYELRMKITDLTSDQTATRTGRFSVSP